MREPDAERGGGAAAGRAAEPRQLDLALAAEAAVAEIIVEKTGMRHELRDPRRQRAQTGQRLRQRPVGAGPRLAEEVVGRAQTGAARALAGGGVLASYGHAGSARDV